MGGVMARGILKPHITQESGGQRSAVTAVSTDMPNDFFLACPHTFSSGVKLVMEATCIMFDEKPKMVDDPNKLGKKIANYWCGV